MCTWDCEYTRICLHVETRGLPWLLSMLSLRQGLSLLLTNLLGQLVSEPWGPTCPHHLVLGLQRCVTVPGFFIWMPTQSLRLTRQHFSDLVTSPSPHFCLKHYCLQQTFQTLELHVLPTNMTSSLPSQLKSWFFMTCASNSTPFFFSFLFSFFFFWERSHVAQAGLKFTV